jgi:hypothetical protein
LTSACSARSDSPSGWNQFRADAGNLFNTPHVNNPNGNLTSGDFLTITRAKNDEQFRLGLRLAF